MSQIKRQAERQRKQKLSERINGASWQPLRHDFLNSPARMGLSASANKLLLDMFAQYNGFNNGDLCAAYEGIMRAKGWRSENTLRKAIKELQTAGILVLTRQGGRNKTPNLYALTCYPIDECGGKLTPAVNSVQLNLGDFSYAA